MKLVSAHVSCFGGLENFSADFGDGLTVILENNGWGKTTLAAFIKAMFYGLPVSKVQDLSKNDRKKYTPWSGKRFGGSLVFEENGTRYRVERTFDPKNGKNDSFSLTDADSGRPSPDYDSDIGLRIFGINAQAFARSVFISRGDLELSDGESAKSVTAKLNGIAEEPEDLGKYDKAMKTLDDRRRYYLATGNRGEIPRTKAVIQELKDELGKRNADAAQADELRAELAAREKEAMSLGTGIEELSRKITRAAGARAAREAKENHARLLERYEKEKKVYEQHAAFFKNSVPGRDAIETLKKEVSGIALLDRTIEARNEPFYVIGYELDKRFGDKKPDALSVSGALSDMRRADIGLRSCRTLTDGESEELESLESLFAGRVPDDKELEDYSPKFTELAALERANAARRSEERPPVKNKSHLIPAVSGVICMIAGLIIASVFSSKLLLLIAGVALALTGALLAGAALVLFIKNYINERTSVLQTAPGHEEVVREAALRMALDKFYSDYPFEKERGPVEALMDLRGKAAAYRRLKALKESCERERAEAQRRTDEAHSKAQMILKDFPDLAGETAEQKLETLTDQLKSYDEHVPAARKQAEESEKAAAKKAEILSKASAFISLYPVSGEGIDALDTIGNRLTAYENSRVALDLAKSDLEKLIAGSGDLINAEEDPDLKDADVSALEEKLAGLRKAFNDERASAEGLKTRIGILSDSADMIPDVSSRLDGECERLAHMERRFEVITTAMEAMEQAKENLSARYLGTIRKRFSVYCSEIAPGLLDGCAIDAGLNITGSESGLTHETGYYSAGTRDMMDLCAKLAVSDALFENDKAFLILDDPLVNLDGEKLERMKETITALAKNRQIIYLTCHGSRAPTV